jgi:hypothetical protein
MGVTLIKQIADRISMSETDTKQSIKDAVEVLDESTLTSKKYDSAALQSLFSYWHRYIPNAKQSIRCNGCRKAVFKFWKRVVDDWEQE